MLRKLAVRNFVLIDALELDFHAGFTAITGETGSGKSILLGALGLLRGDRADFSLIGPESNRSTVEAVFSLNEATHNKLQDLGLEVWSELVVRREIQSDGRSRAFINDTPVSLQDMKSVMNNLLVIHSQYNTLELKDKNYQLQLLDALAGTSALYQDFQTHFAIFLQHKTKLSSLQEQQALWLSKQDYDSFLLNELEALSLERTNYEELALSLSRQEQKQALIELLEALIHCAEGETMATLQSLNAKLQKTAERDPAFSQLKEIMLEILPRLQELGYEATTRKEALLDDTLDTQEMLSQVDEFNRLLNKHRLTNQSALLFLKDELSERSSALHQLTQEILDLETKMNQEEQGLIEKAKALNSLRRAYAAQVGSELKEGFSGLKLKDARIHFELKDTESLNERGMVDLELLFSANQGMELTPMHKAASGGELSRVMLLLQQLISKRMNLPCILFDEIDTGVSGDVADRMGGLLREMGKDRQLLAITHLPQVAAKAINHFKVVKVEDQERTLTRVNPLTQEEQVVEIARLLSGAEIKPEAIQQAQILIG